MSHLAFEEQIYELMVGIEATPFTSEIGAHHEDFDISNQPTSSQPDHTGSAI